jgi:hypothetical protein
MTTEVAETSGLLDERGIVKNREITRDNTSLYVNVTKMGEEILGLEEGDSVQVIIKNDRLVIKPDNEQ